MNEIETIESRRIRLGLTRAQVANACGLSINYYYELERGVKRNPTLEVLEKVARCLGTTPGVVADMVVRGLDADDRRSAM